MKSFALIAILLTSLGVSQLSAQNVKEGTYAFSKKQNEPGLTIVIQGQPKNVETVMRTSLKELTGKRSKESKGIFSIEEVALSGGKMLNVYYRISKAGKDDPNHTRVHFFLAKNETDFYTSQEEEQSFLAARSYLEDLEVEVEIFEMEILVKSQEKLIEKAIGDHDRMLRDSVDLEEKRLEIVERQVENHQEREEQLDHIDQEKQRLAGFRDRLISLKQVYERGGSTEELQRVRGRTPIEVSPNQR
ncbi:hypothetical protein [Pontibacter sp. G13]|uniref:hypothetical protein n=1 Tax=Pontibacter sp. G13 TaxID=3074898 RepID=UPI00288BD12F|nr:hypothetical protein [Pontibacter sp. G13]WNJ18003.1 hypothetical protein RJD25_24370 [Pontibacter sp. G13]